MGELITQLGIGGIFAIMVIDRVLTFLKSKGSNGGNQDTVKEISHDIETKVDCVLRETSHIRGEIKWLTDVHNVKDQDGTYIWYVKTSLTDAIERLADSITQQTKIFERWINIQEVQNNKIDALYKKIEKDY